MFGAVADGSTNDAVALQAWLDYPSYRKRLPAVAVGYATSTVLNVTTSQVIEGDGPLSKIIAKTSGNWATSGASGNFPDSSIMLVRGSLTSLGTLSASPSVGALSIALTSAPTLSAGDVINIYDTVDFSWEGHKAAYRAGEMSRVFGVSGSTVTLEDPLRDSYNSANMVIYKMANIGLTLRNVHFVGAAGVSNCLTLSMLVKPLLENVTLTGADYVGLNVDRCFRPTFVSVTGVNLNTDPFNSVNTYGGVLANTQGCVTRNCRFTGGHAGWSIGGGDFPGVVPNRDYRDYGSVFICTQGNMGLDFHGNVEDARMSGSLMIPGGSFGGKDIYYESCVFESAGTSAAPLGNNKGVLLICSEMYGGTFSLANCLFKSEGTLNGVSRGIIDLGGGGGINNLAVKPINFVLRNVTVRAPNVESAKYVVFALWASGAAAQTQVVSVDIDGIDVTGVGATTLLRVEADNGGFGAAPVARMVRLVGVTGLAGGCTLIEPSGWTTATDSTTQLDIQRQSGIQTVAVTAAGASSTFQHAGVNLNWIYPAVPKVTHSISTIATNPFDGSKKPISFVYAMTSSTIRMGVCSPDNANFAADGNFDVGWETWL